MAHTVGEKIKALRKELHITQAELAGNEMTTSMLSQIENNVSNPSIKTLQYISNKLNKPMSYFLDTQNEKNYLLKDVNISLNEQENAIKQISNLIASSNIDAAQKELEKLSLSNSVIKNIKLYADIHLKLGSHLLQIKRTEDGKRYINISIKTYLDGDFYIEAAKASIELGKGFYEDFNYEECLNIIYKAFDLYDNSINTDPLLEIELYYFKIIILFALGDLNKASEALETAIDLSIKTSIYYKTDELYRLFGLYNYLKGNKEEYHTNLDKAFQFANITNDKICLAKIHYILGFVALESNDASKALEYAETSRLHLQKDYYIYYLIKAKAYYILGDYKLAYENVIKIDFPSNEKHKFDYLNMWSSKIYEGMILNKLGKPTEAIEAINHGIEMMSKFDNTKFLVSAYKSLSEVYSDMKDFQNAFKYLKKANEIQDTISNDENIIF